MLKLSIITINRNDKCGLQKTINSVINQSFTNFEYIIIDGASTDGSDELIKEHSTKINFWLSEPDGGIYSAMNKGILKAQGEYCLFLNSGDYLCTPTVLSDVFENNYDEDILYGQQLHEYNGHLIQTQFLTPKDISFRSFLESTLPHQCTFIKRDLFTLIGLYNENNKIVSDWEFNVLALFKYNCSLRQLDIPISVYDTNGISSSEAYLQLHLKEKKDVLYTNFPRFMIDYNAFEKTEKSKVYRVVKMIKKLLIK